MTELNDRVELVAVRPGEELAWDRLEAYIRERIPRLEGPFAVQQFPNGAANLTYLVSFGDKPLVVRRPPFGELAPGAHDMRREYKLMSRLSAHFSPVPHAYLFCDDHDVIGSDFIVVEYRVGQVIWSTIPPSMAHHRDVARRVGFAVADALAELHVLDPDKCGLGDLGRPVGFLGRQVSGWRHRWDLVATVDEPIVAEVGQRLADTMPSSGGNSILHNDYKLDNCQFDPENPDRVASIFDWDMATLGDPLVDLGILLNYWPDPGDSDGNRPLHVPGLETMGVPSRAEMVARYADRTGFDVSGIRWYEAFATWKTTVVLQQLYRRYERGESTDARMAAKKEPIRPLARRALALLSEP